MVFIELTYGKYDIEDKQCLERSTETTINGEQFFIEIEKDIGLFSNFMRRLKKIRSLNLACMPLYDYGVYNQNGVVLIKKKRGSMGLDEFCKGKLESNYQKYNLINQLINLVDQMHRKRIYHGDICAKNIQVYHDGYEHALYFKNTKRLKEDQKGIFYIQSLPGMGYFRKRNDVYAVGKLASEIFIEYDPTIKDAVKYLRKIKIDKKTSLDIILQKETSVEYFFMLKRKIWKKRELMNNIKSIKSYYVQELDKNKFKEVRVEDDESNYTSYFFYGIKDLNSRKTSILGFNIDQKREKKIIDLEMDVKGISKYKNDCYFISQRSYGFYSKIHKWDNSKKKLKLLLEEGHEITSLFVQKNNIFYGSRKHLLNDYRDCFSRYTMKNNFLQTYEIENENIMAISTYGQYVIYGGWFSGGKFTKLDPVNVYPIRAFDIYKGEKCDIAVERFPIKAIITYKENIYYAVSRLVNTRSYNSIMKLDITSQKNEALYNTDWEINAFAKIDHGFLIAENKKKMYRLVEYKDNKAKIIKKGVGKVVGLA